MRMYKNVLFFLALISLNATSYSQDSAYARQIISKLSSPAFHGRGYVKNGDGKAARFISGELKSLGITPLAEKYRQPFSYPMNIMDGQMELALDNNSLSPVRQFVVAPDCPPVDGNFPLVYLPAAADTNNALYDSLLKVDFGNVFLVSPFHKRRIVRNNPFKSTGFIVPVKNIMWWVAGGNQVGPKPVIHIVDSLLKDKPASITLHIESHMNKEHQTQNLVSFIPGSVESDTFVVFTAHYDHLGYMGNGNYFPGANDNASGTSMVLSLAKQFKSRNQTPYYSVAFIFFAGEEAGLLGSAYFTENPLIPLKNIKALINLDMVSSGSEGISVVNGKRFKQLATIIDSVNRMNNFFTDIKMGDESCNSDQCYFAKKDVPAIFIFTRGKESPYYHILDDNMANAPLTKFNNLEKLLLNTFDALPPK